MSAVGTWWRSWRSLLAVACGLVLTLQLMASAMAASSHLSVKFSASELALTEICGTSPASKGDRVAHVEGVNTCCVWTKSVALSPLAPPASAAMVAAQSGESAPLAFARRGDPSLSAGPKGAPRATGPPHLG